MTPALRNQPPGAVSSLDLSLGYCGDRTVRTMQDRMQVAIGGPQGHTTLARNLFQSHFAIVFQQLADQIQALFLLHGLPPHLPELAPRLLPNPLAFSKWLFFNLPTLPRTCQKMHQLPCRNNQIK